MRPDYQKPSQVFIDTIVNALQTEGVEILTIIKIKNDGLYFMRHGLQIAETVGLLEAFKAKLLSSLTGNHMDD